MGDRRHAGALRAVRIALRSAMALVVSAIVGCGGGSYVIERTVGGEVRRGPFVPPYAYEHYVRAELALAAGDFGAAVDELELARSGADDDPYLCARLAAARHGAGDVAGADRAIAEGLALDPASEAVLLEAGRIAEARGDLDAALARYEAALDAAPRSLDATLALVALLDRRGDHDEAARVLARHLGSARIELAVRERVAAGRLDGAMAILRASPRPPRRSAVGIARSLLAAGRPVLAAEVLAPWHGVAPASSEERSIRIVVAVAMRELDEAEGLLAVPFTAEVAEELEDVRALVAIGQVERALELAEGARARAPSLDADVVLAEALLGAGRNDEAARLAASIPRGSSVSDAAQRVLVEALRRDGLPALAEEVSDLTDR